MKFITWK